MYSLWIGSALKVLYLYQVTLSHQKFLYQLWHRQSGLMPKVSILERVDSIWKSDQGEKNYFYYKREILCLVMGWIFFWHFCFGSVRLWYLEEMGTIKSRVHSKCLVWSKIYQSVCFICQFTHSINWPVCPCKW